MRVLVCSRSDPASRNLRDRLLATGGWEATSRTFRGHPIRSVSEAILVEVEGPSVLDEALDNDLKATNLPVRDVWFLSKHAAASGQPSLTVHPIGNPGEAKFGGQPRTFTPAAARDMGALLRRMAHHAKARGLPHEVTFEATHHGPLLRTPTLFVELGSDERWYADEGGAQAVADAITDVLGGEGRCAGPVLLGLGGGHYAPRATDIGKAGEADFGHLVPAHALELALAEGRLEPLVRDAWAATPGATAVHVHHKSLKGEARRAVLAACAALGLPLHNP